ncbi:cAMP-binding protein [Paramagnetospirillum marisnigri]|uniref:cAMP-binding protein n=1 Tax=Paramagnetospirillum marisnigri TaxID=1285242 RepID=A0A178MWI4_9PROT|nr:Crp/Fnr family transcriptional regulator [Paramagnetospirillum marisnigri]OAN54618.1 cAMP-binding protein [Paramagnetospirillum marisnigri]
MTTLGDIAAFAGLSPQGRQRLAQGAVTHRFPAGKTIVEKGQEVSGAYFVLAGRLRVFTLLPGGKEATLYLLRPGETCVLAMNSLFNDLLYPAWVETEADSAVAIVPGRLYRGLFEDEAVIRDLTVRTLSTLVFRLMAELDQVHACTVEQRLANFLLVRASGTREVRQTQQDIADHIGTTREVVARLTSRLAQRGLIRTGRGRISLLRPSALANLARDEDQPLSL